MMHDYATENCEEEQIYDNDNEEEETNGLITSICTDKTVFDKVVFSAGRDLLYKCLVR